MSLPGSFEDRAVIAPWVLVYPPRPNSEGAAE